MVVEHHVPAARLSYGYFRRWWFGKGVSRCRLEQLHAVTELGVDLSRVRRVAGVPRFMWRTAGRDLAAWAAALVGGNARARVRHAMMLYYFLGYLRESNIRPSAERVAATASDGSGSPARFARAFALDRTAPGLADPLTGHQSKSV
jgi:hypothetical protein